MPEQNTTPAYVIQEIENQRNIAFTRCAQLAAEIGRLNEVVAGLETKVATLEASADGVEPAAPVAKTRKAA